MPIKQKIVLFGAGGHAKVVLDAIQESLNNPQQLIVVDEALSRIGRDLFGRRVISADACSFSADFQFHVAIGCNSARRVVFERLLRHGGVPLSVVHSRAQVSPCATVCDGVFLASGSIIAPASSVAIGAIINHAAVVDHDCYVGEYSHVAPNATLGGNATIGSGVFVGAGAVILPGVTIGDGATVGAGSVVTADVPALATVIGVPGRISQKGG